MRVGAHDGWAEVGAVAAAPRSLTVVDRDGHGWAVGDVEVLGGRSVCVYAPDGTWALFTGDNARRFAQLLIERAELTESRSVRPMPLPPAEDAPAGPTANRLG